MRNHPNEGGRRSIEPHNVIIYQTTTVHNSLNIACIMPSCIFTLSLKHINFLPRPWPTACYISQNLEIKLIHFRIFFFILLLCDCFLEESSCMFFPSLHHKILFQNVSSICVFFTVILLDIQNRNHSLNSSQNFYCISRLTASLGFVVEISQYLVYQQYDKKKENRLPFSYFK